MRVTILMTVVSVLLLDFQGASCGSRNNRNSATANQSTSSENLNAASATNMNNQSNNQETAETWGGNHIQIDVRGDIAKVEFDCAHGEISKPVKTDSEGNFDLPGTFVSEGGGPTRADREPAARSVKYRGKIVGDTMTLSITFSDNNESAGSFTLKRGKQGRIRKCL